MRAVFFCVAALSVTWCDLAWVFLGGAIVAAVARVAVSKTTITMRRLEVARQFIISTYVTGFFTLLARYFSGCASRSISMRLWTEFAKGSNFRNLALFGSGYAGLGIRMLHFPPWPPSLTRATGRCTGRRWPALAGVLGLFCFLAIGTASASDQPNAVQISVLDEKNQPVAGATISVTLGDLPVTTAATDASGKATVTLPLSGNYLVSISKK